MTQDTDLLKTLYPIGLLDGRDWRVGSMGMPLHGPSAQYAITLFEGLIGYPVGGGIGIVALREHFQRLLDGALKSGLGFDRDPGAVERLVWDGMEALPQLLRTNRVSGTVYIRPTLYHQGTGNVCLGPALEGGIHLGIYLQKWDGYLSAKPEGVRVIVSDFVKASSPVAHLKCSANYGLAIPAKREARLKGFDEVLFRDELGMLAEASSQNVVVDFGDEASELSTPLAEYRAADATRNAPVLPGITLRILRETIAPDLGFEIREDVIDPRMAFDPRRRLGGIALCGTASEVRHVGSLRWAGEDAHAFERPSPRIQALMDGYAKLTRGEAYREWLTVIPL
ncbi:MAG TPA: aminotransferase class IV [Candidatus Baltobacteraceae bacterium]|nr:aminotransferase class IV [Candidatus Baltobacteraceae bacterium]